jgi:hypothetical protein
MMKTMMMMEVAQVAMVVVAGQKRRVVDPSALWINDHDHDHGRWEHLCLCVHCAFVFVSAYRSLTLTDYKHKQNTTPIYNFNSQHKQNTTPTYTTAHVRS